MPGRGKVCSAGPPCLQRQLAWITSDREPGGRKCPGCDDLGRPLCRSGLFRVMDHIAQNFRAANPRSLPGSAECQGWKSSKVFISGELSHVGILSKSSRPHRGLYVHSRIAWHEFKHADCCFCDSHCRSLTGDVCATLRLRWSRSVCGYTNNDKTRKTGSLLPQPPSREYQACL